MKKLMFAVMALAGITAFANNVVFQHDQNFTMTGKVNDRYVCKRFQEFPAEPNTWYRASAEIRCAMEPSDGRLRFRVRNVRKDGSSIVYANPAVLKPVKLDYTHHSDIFMTKPDCARLQVYFILDRVNGTADIRNVKIEKISAEEVEKILASKRVEPAFFSPAGLLYEGERSLFWGYRVSAAFVDPKLIPATITFSVPGLKINAKAKVKVNDHVKVWTRIPRPAKAGKYPVVMKALDKDGKVLLENNSVLKVIKRPAYHSNYPAKTVAIDTDGNVLVNGKRTLVIGIYHAHNTAGAKNSANAGINAAQTWAPKPASYKKVLDIMAANKLYANCVLKNINGKKLEDLYNTIKDHPAVFSWDIVDEPAIRNIKPEHLEACTTQLRNYKTLRPLRISFSDPTAVKPYQQHYDIAAVHKYVLPYDGLAKQGVTVRHIIKNILPGQAPHITLQSWVHWHDETQSPQSAVQTRSQGYLALINGATGVWWYHYPTAYAIPQIWGALKQFGAELNELEPFFTGKRIPLKSSTPNVEAAQFINGGKSIVVAVNTGMSAETVTFSEIKGKKLSELFADKAEYSTSDKIVIPPQDTRIFECL